MKNPAAVALGSASWKKRSKKFKTKKHMSAIGALGAAKTNEIKRKKREALATFEQTRQTAGRKLRKALIATLDKIAIHSSNI
jgi:hypothetical protein